MSPAVASPAALRKDFFDQGFTLQGVSILLGLVVAIVTILGFMRKNRREDASDAQARTDRIMTEVAKHNDSMEDRVKELEVKSRDFMPRAEIEGKIEHEKANRMASQAQLATQAERNTNAIVEIKVSVGKLEQKQDGLASDMGEIKALVKEQGRDVAARLEKMQDCLSSINKKV